MEYRYKLALFVGVPITVILLIFIVVFQCRIILRRLRRDSAMESSEGVLESGSVRGELLEMGGLLRFRGGEALTAEEILEAPGEIIGKSSYATVYKASLTSWNGSESVKVLRFLPPSSCAENGTEAAAAIEILGSIRHSNLVPLQAIYAGSRGEKLLVYPFYGQGNLSQFIRDGNGHSYKWPTIYKISVDIAKGLHHLHNGLQSPMAHGNLKSKNVLLDDDYRPRVSDFGLRLLLNPASSQELAKASVAQGYKHLDKTNDSNEKENDIFSLGVIFLELVTRKEPIIEISSRPNRKVTNLTEFVREAVTNDRVSLCHPDIVSGENSNEIDQILKFFDLAFTCCSPSPSFRPSINKVLETLLEIAN